MEIPRQHYTEESKQEAVKLVRESGLCQSALKIDPPQRLVFV